MVAVSGGLIFLGYQLLVYGWSQVNGQNAGFFDILWPGRYQGNTPDSGALTSFGSGGGLLIPSSTPGAGYPGAPAAGQPYGSKPAAAKQPGSGFTTPITGAH